MISCSSTRYEGSASDHFDGQRFFNPGGASKKSFFDFLKWKLFGKPAPWPEWIEVSQKNWKPWDRPQSHQARVSFVNHASVLIEFSNFRILTDPQFSKRTSPVQWLGPKRRKAPGILLENLPKIDVVLVSHNHYDHLDIESLKRLTEKDQPLILVPLGDCSVLSSIPNLNCQEMDWGDVTEWNSQVELTFLPAQHWSARGLFDRNRSLWGSYVVEAQGKKIYFAGDTGWGSHFKEIGDRFQGFDLALLPIGAYEPRWFMKDHHMNPAEAVRAHLDLRARHSLGIHWGTFQLTDEAYDEPLKLLDQARKDKGLSNLDFFTLENGESFLLEGE